jgi:leucyl-tRNA synthetase
MQGYNVLYPIGWDAFGLPTENYAIKTGIAPAIVTKKNTDNFRKQLQSLGFSFDWSREVNTTDPKYYKWTQWIFLQFLKHDLAYKAKMAINWCPKDKIGLANEEVVNGCCERCGTPVEKREKEQWMLAITKYADRLDTDLDTVDYLDRVKIQQRNWIGKSEGAEIDFTIQSKTSVEEKVKVFTTRPDTIFGATYVVLAPEHSIVSGLKFQISNWKEVEKYIEQVKNKPEEDRTAVGKNKTGIELKGLKAINPATKEKIPVWIADYVLSTYGTGAIMAVPADDKRDEEFATKFNLPIIKNYTRAGFNDFGKKVIKYKLRDWVFSRQRYWGEPIPVVHCEKCGVVPLPEKDLPLVLPKVDKYQPTDTGESPLASITKWVNIKCPKCKCPAKRETDTMPNWAGSSWYFLRYADAKNSKAFADPKKLKYWMPVDWYNGGMEHTTLHLLYSRFWNKFLFDIGVVPTSEPYTKRTSHGLILAKGGEKMSKSKGNVVNPDKIVEMFGADTLRAYEMFMGPFDQAIEWGEDNIVGVRRFLEKVWKLQLKVKSEKLKVNTNANFESLLHRTIKKVGDDIESMSFNTAVSAMMILVNEFEKQESIAKKDFEMFLKILSPFAPHITEEIWHTLGNKTLLVAEKWPTADQSKMTETEVKIVIQVNSKVRDTFVTTPGITENDLVAQVKGLPAVDKWLSGKEIKKVVYVPNKLINFVVI